MEIRARNVQEAYCLGLAALRRDGVWQETRNGRALVHPEPVLTRYERPMERVLLDGVRDANPFFHLMESLWMLAGRNDVASLAPFNAGLKTYSDDGVSYHGAYGHRWRHHFEDGEPYEAHTMGEGPTYQDQLARIIQLLRANPDDRRVVLAMWDPVTDLGQDGADFPCNTQVYFRTRLTPVPPDTVTPKLQERARARPADMLSLDITVTCRSNDAIWGAYGANAVHFSVLQEFVAAACGFRVGTMWQLSNNLHAYEDKLQEVGVPAMPVTWAKGGRMFKYAASIPMGLYRDGLPVDEYKAREVKSSPLFADCSMLTDQELMTSCDETWAFVQTLWGTASEKLGSVPLSPTWTSEGLDTVRCMVASYWNFKRRRRKDALGLAHKIPAPDWQRACVEWLERRYA